MSNLQPLSTSNSPLANNNSVNDMVRRLNKEATVKVFKNGQNNSLINGKLPYDGGAGSLYYDTSGIPNILIGIAPDGRPDICAANDGVDVTTLYS